jgi:hypothetical protein
MDDAERIAELEVAVRRGIAKIKQLAPWVMWDEMEDGRDQAHTWLTVELMERALVSSPDKLNDDKSQQ